MTLTNISAEAVNTIEWLSAANTTIAVPVYQRQYRWEIDGCDQLLADIRRVALGHPRQTHFLGSLLYTATTSGDVTERMLVDGQQRVATLMLLVAALRDTLVNADDAVVGRLQGVLLHPAVVGLTRLRLRREGELELDSIVFGQPFPDVGVQISHLRDNYNFFLDAVRNDARTVWDGLQKLEHVAITLEENASPQQVFESLNSTGAPLRNQELIHNYILMGLTYEQQTKIEDSFWAPIEENTGDAIDTFLRDYLILTTGRDSEFRGEHGVYDVFKKQFPRPTIESLVEHAAEWKSYSEVYLILLDPVREVDNEIRRQLHYINTFGSAIFPFLLGVYRDYQRDVIDRNSLLEVLEQLQSLYLRRLVVGASRDHLAAQLCRKRQQYGYPISAIVRRTPPDERIRAALRNRPLPHAGYVLGRIDEPGDLGELEIEHIFPQLPKDTWSGDGTRYWHAFNEVERAKFREILPTIGNLALLEPGLNAAASNSPFNDKKDFYRQSRVLSTKALAEQSIWDLNAVAERTQELTGRFLEIWKRRVSDDREDLDDLVPILDVPKKPGWYPGWDKEFEYAVFKGEVWEVQNLKSLFNRVFKWLWTNQPKEVLAYSEAHRGPVFKSEEWKSQWNALPGSHYLFMGLVPQYMLAEMQGILDELNMAEELSVKYSTDED